MRRPTYRYHAISGTTLRFNLRHDVVLPRSLLRTYGFLSHAEWPRALAEPALAGELCEILTFLASLLYFWLYLIMFVLLQLIMMVILFLVLNCLTHNVEEQLSFLQFSLATAMSFYNKHWQRTASPGNYNVLFLGAGMLRARLWTLRPTLSRA